MSRRKPIYLVRMGTRTVVVTGMLTIDVAEAVPEATRRTIIADLVRRLRSIGLEATPKQPEAKR